MCLRKWTAPTGKVMELDQGNIIDQEVDAIVNAANSRLSHGAGVAGAIVSRGGSVIQSESNEWVRLHGSVSHSEPAYTSAGSLPSKFVIHAVGPIWGSGGEDAKLEAAIRGSLRRAVELGLGSIAFPAISTGVFGFPEDRAAGIILKTIRAFTEEGNESSLKLARVVLYSTSTAQVFQVAWDELFKGKKA